MNDRSNPIPPPSTPLPPPSDSSFIVHRSSFSWLALLIVLLACTAVRTWLISHAEMISRDGVTYIKMAREWSQNPSAVIHNYSYHVGYPAAISAMHRLLSSFGLSDRLDTWELAARLVSLLSALVATTAVWLFAALTFDYHIAFITTILLCAARKWAILGADVTSDALALAFQTSAVLLTLLVLIQLKKHSPFALLLALPLGLCAGAGYLVRPESLVVVAIAVVIWLTHQLRSPATPWKLTIAAILTTAFSALALAAPYMLAIGTLTKKKRFDQIIPFANILPLAMTGNDYNSGLRELINQLTEAMHPVLFVLALGWLVLWSGFRIISRGQNKPFNPAPRPAGAAVMLLTAAAFTPLLLGLHSKVHYLNFRHIMLLGLLLSPLAGAGVLLAAYIISDSLRRFSQTFRLRTAYILLALLLAPMLVHALHPLKQFQSHYRDAALQLAQLLGPNDFFLARSPWIFHYSQANGEYYYTEKLTPKMLLDRITRISPTPTYLVYSDDDLRAAHPSLPHILRPPLFTELHRFAPHDPKSRDTVHIYRITPPLPLTPNP